MTVGLTGSHRVGKTTLARAFAEAEGWRFIQTNTSGVFARLGLDPKAEYPFKKRLEIQNHILDSLEADYRGAGLSEPFITDRTPIDLMTYTLSDVQRSTLDEADGKAILKYMDRCFELTNQTFSVIVLVQPGIKIVEDASKAQGEPGYMEHFNSLARGLMASEKITCEDFFIPRRITNLAVRVESIRKAIEQAQARLADSLGRSQGSLVLH